MSPVDSSLGVTGAAGLGRSASPRPSTASTTALTWLACRSWLAGSLRPPFPGEGEERRPHLGCGQKKGGDPARRRRIGPDQKLSALMTSPPALVARAHQVALATVFLMNRTDPS